MAENFLELKTINELTPYSFYIPSYQRGYRWTKQQVTDLLEDIKDFVPQPVDNQEEKTWYCLQPIVVKKLNNNHYEVIDGQQRLTTIYLILHYINQGYVKDRQKPNFSLDYETRKDTAEFLKNPAEERDDNIDYCYISKAYKVITEWFEELEKNDLDFSLTEFETNFRKHTKVVWYETFEDNPISIFTRLNIGKISLTNSELIKALFLNTSNYSKEATEERIRLRQIEIATEWDEIEYGLQNDKLWYFLTNEEKKENRIELIFKLIANEKDTAIDPYATFRFFSNKMKSQTEQIINSTWKEIKSYYQRFNEWYNERDLYHKIGFILYAGLSTLSKLYEYSSNMKKSDFKEKIENIIKDKYKNLNLKDLQYEDKNVVSVLLLYNILTMLQNNNDDSYFPFNLFKEYRWNVEHIASVKDTMPEEKDRERWISDVLPYIDETIQGGTELILKIKNFSNIKNEEEFKILFSEIINHFNYHMDNECDVNGLPNLALLDEATNKGYKNAVFPIKRKTIIDRDKSGVFIPLCTKNVFLKYFSDYPPRISFWTKDDREKYEDDLNRVLSQYVGLEVKVD